MKKNIVIILQLAIIVFFIVYITDDVFANTNVNDLFEQEQDESPNSEEQQPENANENELVSTNDSLLLDLIKMILMLVIVLGLIYFLLKFLQKRNKMFQQVQSLENLGGISLGSNKSIQMIRIGSKIYVVGVGENITLLTDLDDEKLVDELINNDQNTQQGNNSMRAFFNQFKGFTGKQDGEAKSFKKLFSKELDSMKRDRKELIDNYHKKKEEENE